MLNLCCGECYYESHTHRTITSIDNEEVNYCIHTYLTSECGKCRRFDSYYLYYDPKSRTKVICRKCLQEYYPEKLEKIKKREDICSIL